MKVVIDAGASVLELRARGEDRSVIHPLINLPKKKNIIKVETLNKKNPQ